MIYEIKPGLSIQETEDGLIILDKESNEIHQLNLIAAFIWNSISNKKNNIPDLICSNFLIDKNIAQRDFNFIISELIDRKLIKY